MTPLTLAVEDQLSEALVRKLLAYLGGFQVQLCLGGTGIGNLQKNIHKFQQAAHHQPYLLVVDLDRPGQCPSTLRRQWLGKEPEPYLLFRIAVVESESWLLGHQEAIIEHLNISPGKARIPDDTDSLADPKQFLINLARKSRSRQIRDELVPRPRSTTKVGPNYNANLGLFVRRHWEPNIAKDHSPSLARALSALRNLSFP